MNQPNRGRPPKPPGEVKTEVFTVRCTPSEKKEYEQLKTEPNKKETTK